MVYKLILFFCVLASVKGAAYLNYTVHSYLTAHHADFLNLLDQAGLTSILQNGESYTIFVPPKAFVDNLDTNIVNNQQSLRDLLQYHIVNGTHTKSEIDFNENLLQSLQGSEIRINHYYFNERLTPNRFYTEGQRILTWDIVTSDGVLHLLDGMMSVPVGSVTDVLSNDGELTTFLTAVQMASLENFLHDQTPITVFAPTDKAFANLSTTILPGLLKQPSLLSGVLKYHMVPGTLYSEVYHAGLKLPTFQGDHISFNRFFGLVTADGYPIPMGNISATNGVVHKIDHVLIPKSLSSQIQALLST